MINDYITSLIRTAVPFIVSAALAIPGAPWLIDALGVDSAKAQAGLTSAVTFGLGLIYYVLVRALEHWKPSLGALLGVPKMPVYATTSVTVPLKQDDPAPAIMPYPSLRAIAPAAASTVTVQVPFEITVTPASTSVGQAGIVTPAPLSLGMDVAAVRAALNGQARSTASS